jgi:asparagine synthase (glutamine-hydrolysing)
MSGMLAVLRTDGAPVDPVLVRRMTESLTLRGPDALATWCDGQIGLGHTLLKSTFESETESQPFSFDRKTWIVADGRVDARDELIQALSSDAGEVSKNSPDVELILRAYLCWGERCVERLLGDFAFAVWDALKRRLFCARDHMGVKPFYYARVGRWLLVSSTVESLRGHEQVSSTLNDMAIADFLLFGSNQDSATTSFRDIQRLPPAHTLTWSESGLDVRRYWTLPIEEPLYYRRDTDYIDQFNELVHRAVSDRLRIDKVGVFMSGGLDSTALAAAAVKTVPDRGVVDPVRAFTCVFDSLIADSERMYAGAAASHLGIPIQFYSMDEQPGWVFPSHSESPEPVGLMEHRGRETTRLHSDMAAHSAVAFYGEGPDNALEYEWAAHLRCLARRRMVRRLALDLGKHLLAHKRILSGLVRKLRTPQDVELDRPSFPECLSPELVARLELRKRWDDYHLPLTSAHPARPVGYGSLLLPLWQSIVFETLEPSYTRMPLEVRHPFVDIRVLRFLLRVPNVPWCRDKYLVRQALRGVVPEIVRRRKKVPLSANPDHERVRRFGFPDSPVSPALGRYGDAGKLSSGTQSGVASIDIRLGFVALNRWLEGIQQDRLFQHGRDTHEIAETVVVA